MYRFLYLFCLIFLLFVDTGFCNEAYIERISVDGVDVAEAMGYKIIKYKTELPIAPEIDPVAGYNGLFWVEEYISEKKNPIIHDKGTSGFGKGGSGTILIKFPDRGSYSFNYFVNDHRGLVNGTQGEVRFDLDNTVGATSWYFIEKESIKIGKDIILGIRLEGYPALEVSELRKLEDKLNIMRKEEIHRMLVFKCKINKIAPLSDEEMKKYLKNMRRVMGDSLPQDKK